MKRIAAHSSKMVMSICFRTEHNSSETKYIATEVSSAITKRHPSFITADSDTHGWACPSGICDSGARAGARGGGAHGVGACGGGYPNPATVGSK